mmetsp:Transcript_85910/g.135637  ORF Transcript_85910/g.135637 Transcript_85910/m.135637 type:complete len:239 (-) Transcript_85910:29-745(-)
MSNSCAPTLVDHTCKNAVHARAPTKGIKKSSGPDRKPSIKIFATTLLNAEAIDGTSAAKATSKRCCEAATSGSMQRCGFRSAQDQTKYNLTVSITKTLRSDIVKPQLSIAKSLSSEKDQNFVLRGPLIMAPMQPLTRIAPIHKSRRLSFSPLHHGTSTALSKIATLARGATSDTGASNTATYCAPGLTTINMSNPNLTMALFSRAAPSFCKSMPITVEAADAHAHAIPNAQHTKLGRT